jgi:hypothetical protein
MRYLLENEFTIFEWRILHIKMENYVSKDIKHGRGNKYQNKYLYKSIMFLYNLKAMFIKNKISK